MNMSPMIESRNAWFLGTCNHHSSECDQVKPGRIWNKSHECPRSTPGTRTPIKRKSYRHSRGANKSCRIHRLRWRAPSMTRLQLTLDQIQPVRQMIVIEYPYRLQQAGKTHNVRIRHMTITTKDVVDGVMYPFQGAYRNNLRKGYCEIYQSYRCWYSPSPSTIV